MKYITPVMLFTVLLLSGCMGAGDTSDLQAFVDEVSSKPRGRIEPLPEFAHYSPFTYSAGALRSPFESPVELRAMQMELKGNRNVKPDLSREHEALESFAIADIQLVGTLAKAESKKLNALMKASDGSVHVVTVGNYLGKNYGRIIKIDDDHVEIVEIVPSGDGGWIERPRTMVVKESAGGK
ncbi:MAG: pilus assembly protein PilP [Oceanospirillaceae bacterium]|nr:pilus assembly protein PilP [Oceanospirillaceae bacterium]MCP5351144.1 pilus assembly protein PilP [Oceanospirillaceae bacterium]